MYSRLIIATLNDGKVREFQSLLRLAGLPLVPAAEAGIRDFPTRKREIHSRRMPWRKRSSRPAKRASPRLPMIPAS